MNRLAVIGHPVAHSLSPAMHAAAFEALGIGERLELRGDRRSAPEHFARGSDELRGRGFAGVNVTVPHKGAAFELADRALRRRQRDRRRQHAQLRRRRGSAPTTPTRAA